jgi:hypothetical protein
MSGLFFQPLLSALQAGVLSFASPKESSQRKSDPRVGALRVPCATRLKRGLRNSGFALRQSSPFLRLSLRCSAPLMGTREASRNDGSAQGKPANSSQIQNSANSEFNRFGGDAFPGPHVERRATELMADKGRGLSEARRAKFRSPRQLRVAQGSRRSRPRSLGSPSSLSSGKSGKASTVAETKTGTDH